MKRTALLLLCLTACEKEAAAPAAPHDVQPWEAADPNFNGCAGG